MKKKNNLLNHSSRYTLNYITGLNLYAIVYFCSQILVCICTLIVVVSQVMNTPHLTDCCGHHYCQSCLSHWLDKASTHLCPFCRDTHFNHIQDKQLQRKINELIVLCSNSPHGCKWKGPLIDLEHHLNNNSRKGCDYELVNCPQKCGQLFERKDVAIHITNDCKFREVCCEHCGITTTHLLLDNHFITCEQLPIPCPKNCHMLVKRCNIDYHMQNDCPKEKIPCLFHDCGCNILIRRDDYEDHVEQCKDKYIVKAHEKVLSEVQSIRDEIFMVKAENSLLRSKIISLQEGLEISYKNAQFLKHQNSQLKSVLIDELGFLHASIKPCEILSVDCIRTQLRKQVIHLNPGECATFRFSNYSMHKNSGQVWYSPKFYITHGYAFCLAVHLNGVGAGRGTHVSIYLHQTIGEFDSVISWPFSFQEELEIKLMSQQELMKESRVSTLFKSGNNSPSSSHRLYAGISMTRGQSSSLMSETDQSKTPVQEQIHSSTTRSQITRSPIMHRKVVSEVKKNVNVIECQVMSISRVLNCPAKTLSQAVAKLELFCLQKTVDASVFLNSIVFQCKFGLCNDHLVSPTELADIEWEKWMAVHKSNSTS